MQPRSRPALLLAALVLLGGAAEAQAPAPKPQPRLRLVANVPAGRMDLVRGDSVVKSYPVSVGTSRHPTPTGTFWISRMIWNPRWHPPESEWARGRKPEPPGPRNPMGRVKLHISELYYIHGTTSVGRLGGPASHGCIRMANADIIDLTRRLHADRTPGFGKPHIDWLVANSGVTHPVPLHLPVRLDVVYRLAELRNDQVQLHPDVYRRGGRALAEAKELLRRSGRPAEEVEHRALADASREWARTGRARVPLATLAAPYVPPPPPEPVLPEREIRPRLLGVEVARADSAGPGGR
ncbi:MAG TPA: L,D-transpeptidase [Longimicrobiaceae bacterium]|nr:L,D-transpeptidase [Longimicrobiaceae bacterium]